MSWGVCKTNRYKRTCEFGKAFQFGWDPMLLEDRKINWPMDATSLLLLGGWTNSFELNMRKLNKLDPFPRVWGEKKKYVKRPPIGYQISQTLNVRMVYLPATMVDLAFANVNVGTYSTYMKSAWDWFELLKDTFQWEFWLRDPMWNGYCSQQVVKHQEILGLPSWWFSATARGDLKLGCCSVGAWDGETPTETTTITQ